MIFSVIFGQCVRNHFYLGMIILDVNHLHFSDDSGSPGGDITSKFRTNNKPMYSTNNKLMYSTNNKPLYQSFHITNNKHAQCLEQIINPIIKLGFL